MSEIRGCIEVRWARILTYPARDFKRGRLTGETRTKTSAEPDEIEYNIEYQYDQLGNRTTRYDNVAEKRTDYTYDTDLDPNTMDYPTKNNRLVEYKLYDTSGQSDVLLRTVSYVYYKCGWASNITIKDEYVDGTTTPGDPNDYDWYHDLALYYFTNGALHSTLAGKWLPDPNGNPDEETYTTESLGGREFRYDSLRARYATIRYNTPSPDRGTWTVADDMHWTDYDGDTPYGDFEVEEDTFTRTEITRYLGLAGQQAVSGGAETYYHGDQIGSTMATSDPNGDITGLSGGAFAPVVYTAFGEFLDSSGLAGGEPPSGHPRYAYAGAFGYETGGFGGDDRLLWRDGANPNLPPITLQHVGARWYQPEIGRFVQRDPIGIGGGLNEYGYAYDAPQSFVDPDGRFVLIATGVAVGTAGIIYGIHNFYWGCWAGSRIADNERRMKALNPSIRPSLSIAVVCIRDMMNAPGTSVGFGPPGLPKDTPGAIGVIVTEGIKNSGVLDTPAPDDGAFIPP